MSEYVKRERIYDEIRTGLVPCSNRGEPLTESPVTLRRTGRISRNKRRRVRDIETPSNLQDP